MKALIKAVALTAVLSTQAFAAAPTITKQDCINLHGYSSVIMKLKARGMDMATAMNGESNDIIGELRKLVIVDAYSTPTYNSDDLNLNAAANFSAKWLKACMGAIK